LQPAVPGVNAYIERQRRKQIDRAMRVVPRERQWQLYLLSLVVSDLLMSGMAFRIAYAIRFEMSIQLFKQDVVPSISYYESLVLVIIPVWLGIFWAMGLYNRQNLLGGTREYARVFNATTAGLFMVIAVGFLVPDLIVARGWLLAAWGLVFLTTAVGRFVLRRVVYELREDGYFLSPAVIVGANDEGVSLAQQLSRWKTSGLHIVGFVDKKLTEGKEVWGGLSCLGSVDELEEIVEANGVEEIILATSAISSRERMLEIFKRYGVAKGVNVRLSSGLYEIITTGLTVKEFAYVPLVGVNPVRLSGLDKAMKVVLDYSLTLAGLVALLPMMGLIGLLIKLDSEGPVIHRRRVMGVNGVEFDAYKFRTMVVNGEEVLAGRPELQAELKAKHKLRDDPRVTRVGKWLRKTSLDELPQLLNVLKGQMSLVGPRMITPEEIDQYDQWDLNLLTVRPGLTGLWQVNGRSEVSYEQRVQYDMQYVRNWSIWLDLQLLYQTIPAVIKGRGAF
jgi:exopolysaccharide biosynthesis polyprenyl glycosylphosphotransferase